MDIYGELVVIVVCLMDGDIVCGFRIVFLLLVVGFCFLDGMDLYCYVYFEEFFFGIYFIEVIDGGWLLEESGF